MTAEPSDPRLDALEGRVAALEEYQGQVLPFVQAATRAAVGALHGDVLALRQEVTRNGQRLDQVEAEVATVARLQIEHGALLGTVAGKVDGLEHKVDSLERKVGGLGGTVDSLQRTVDAHGDVLASVAAKVDSHGELLQEILRRLPAAGE